MGVMSPSAQTEGVSTEPNIVGEGRVAVAARNAIRNAACPIAYYRRTDADGQKASATHILNSGGERHGISGTTKSQAVADQILRGYASPTRAKGNSEPSYPRN